MKYLLDVVTNAPNTRIVVGKFELQSYGYVYFRSNTFSKNMNLLSPNTG